MSTPTTIRDLIAALNELAEESPAGENTEVEFGICNGTALQMVDDIDVSHSTRVQADGLARVRVSVLFRAHVHPGEKPGELLRGVAADVDQELRDLLDDSE